ncbi:MAG TPA: hypothetical protein VG755_20735 [Nannocystaceae bacterium]|nr:hypothetical protein [Nannocystaceae bacterium]
MSIDRRAIAILSGLALAACGGATPQGDVAGSSSSSGPSATTAEPTTSTTAPGTGEVTSDGGDESSESTGGEPDAIHITHSFGTIALDPFEDDVATCASWTLDNELALYVNKVTMANLGAFHHSNWFVIPEDEFAGEDGYWTCADRGFDEIAASTNGATVLFAQSTQSYTEAQELSPGAVVKIPPRHKVIATLHTLNASPDPSESELWLSLYPIHPSEVTAVVTALSMQYHDLHIPPQQESRFTADCDLSAAYWLVNQEPLAMRLHYILPHYHYLGNFFEVKVKGGLRDGEVVYSLDGFNGSANGLTFDPPLDLPGATGIEFSCGYDNWRSEEVTWGNGGGEMCVMLALVESDAVMGASVDLGNHPVGTDGDVDLFAGTCLAIGLPKPPEQGMPTEQEILAPLYLPPVDPEDQDIPPIPQCKDSNPAVPPDGAPTLSRISDVLFAPSCTYSSCHGMNAAAGLQLDASDLHAELMNHQPTQDTDRPLVAPGDPEGSHLYQLLAHCNPASNMGDVLPHMPLNAPFLLGDDKIALVREWIEAGAPDD